MGNSTTEIWKSCPGFETLYEVSTFGNVRSKKTNKPKKGRDNGHGYLSVAIYKNNKCSNKYIHRLVAETFIPNPDNKPQVNHKNGNKGDNRVENLEWCSSSENAQHAIKVLKTKPGRGSRKAKNIRCIETNEVFYSSLEFRRITGLDGTAIRNCLCGKAKTAWGFHWEYTNLSCSTHDPNICYKRRH